MSDYIQNRDPLKLVREGTSQDQRLSPALDPAYAPVDKRTLAHRIVFAQAYSVYLIYYNSNNAPAGDWKPFFSEDVSAQLAVAAVQDVTYYRQEIKEIADFLNDLQNKSDTKGLRDHLDYLFSCCATLAIRLDHLKNNLPTEIALKQSLQNLVRGQLAPALTRLIAYRRGGEKIAGAKKPINESNDEKAAVKILDGKIVPIRILGCDAVKLSELGTANLSEDWTNGLDWKTYYGKITGDAKVYGTLTGTDVFDRINHIATHNLFTSILDQFLKAYARTKSDAKRELEETFTKWDHHQPHYALFLAFLRLFEYSRAEANSLTGQHLDFYYREILRLKEKAAEPGKTHLLVELAKQADSTEIKKDVKFKAGKDDLGRDAFFVNDRDFVANQTKVAALKTVYRHGEDKLGNAASTEEYQGRLFASLVANSDDGLGADLTSVDQSWHPFFNKTYKDGVLSEINMPEAEVGFAIASHYLWMAQGTRTITLDFTIETPFADSVFDPNNDVVCLFTSEKGWINKTASTFESTNGVLSLVIILTGADPAVVPYSAKTHGYSFATNLPILLVKLNHQDDSAYLYSQLQDVVIEKIDLNVQVKRLKTLAVSNDFGPVDSAKPFQPYGASPTAGSSLIIGSKEVFQKKLTEASIHGEEWFIQPNPYKTTPMVKIDFLNDGQWLPSNIDTIPVESKSFDLTNILDSPVVGEPDLTPNEFFSTASRHGFVRLWLDDDFGQSTYQTDLLKYLNNDSSVPDPPSLPVGPSMSELWINYSAAQSISLDSTDVDGFNKRKAHFFNLMHFGFAEQHPYLKAKILGSESHNSDKAIYLLPQLKHLNTSDGKLPERYPVKHEAELYIGIIYLKPPQNLALLFQVADGTTDPLSEKPKPHIHWSYLRGNEWVSFAENEVEDQTKELLNSGIVSFAVPRDASDTNTLLPTGMHWIRAAVATEPDAVCRLRMIAAQALEVTFTDKGNDPTFPAKVLTSGTISRLDQPDAAIKKITQPFATFAGRGEETPNAFYTRISERLRHKDRAIALWDYERLVLEAFPQIYKAKCLNHTRYEPNESGSDIYKELAPGHVTIVTILNQQFHNIRDPLRPFTSLGLLDEIHSFLSKRLSCFVNLHIKNPEFEEVWVKFNVRLYAGLDDTFYVNKLQKAITRYLSPWAFAGGGSPSFGGKIYKSVLINFAEEQPYVDYVTDFKLFHRFKGNDGAQQEIEKNEVKGSKAVSILVSGKEHKIEPIKPAEENTPGEKCPCEA